MRMAILFGLAVLFLCCVALGTMNTQGIDPANDPACVDGSIRFQERKAILDLDALRPQGKLSFIL